MNGLAIASSGAAALGLVAITRRSVAFGDVMVATDRHVAGGFAALALVSTRKYGAWTRRAASSPLGEVAVATDMWRWPRERSLLKRGPHHVPLLLAVE
jgi:hypothetical protein